MRDYKTVILGASYYAVGCAMAKSECLIVERTQLADPFFFGTLNGFYVDYSDKWAEETRAFYNLCVLHGAVDGNRFNALYSEQLLSWFIKENSLKILLYTDVVGIEKCGELYRVTLINNGGLENITAENIIDCRYKSPKTRLNILCKGNFSDKVFLDNGDFKIELSEAFEKDEKVFTFIFKEEMDVNTAKMKALNYLFENFRDSENKIIQCAYLMHGVENEKSLFDAFDSAVKGASK